MPTPKQVAAANAAVQEAADSMDLTAEAAAIFEGEKLDDPVVDVSTAKRPVIAKLAQIMAGLPTINPEGRNSHFGYGFIKDTQVSGVIRPRMARLGLMLIFNVIEESQSEYATKQGRSFLTKLKVMFTIYDAESGDSVQGTTIGYGDDAGDKGANKALTAAQKYFLMKIFQIGGEDLEDDAAADRRASDRETGFMTQTNGDVSVVGKQIDGIAKGGKSDKVSSAQLSAIVATVKLLGWDSERVVKQIEATLGDALETTESDAGEIVKAYLRGLSGDDAGKLLTALQDAKDANAEAAGGGDE